MDDICIFIIRLLQCVATGESGIRPFGLESTAIPFHNATPTCSETTAREGCLHRLPLYQVLSQWTFLRQGVKGMCMALPVATRSRGARIELAHKTLPNLLMLALRILRPLLHRGEIVAGTPNPPALLLTLAESDLRTG